MQYVVSRFSRTQNIGNTDIIANFVLPYLQFSSLSAQCNLSKCELRAHGVYAGITIQGCRLHWSCLFPTERLKQSWQYWHSCIVQRL